jgi:hypothetical protein
VSSSVCQLLEEELAFHRGLKPCPPPPTPLRDENGLSTGAAEEKDEGTHNPTTGGAALAGTSGAYFEYMRSGWFKRTEVMCIKTFQDRCGCLMPLFSKAMASVLSWDDDVWCVAVQWPRGWRRGS